MVHIGIHTLAACRIDMRPFLQPPFPLPLLPRDRSSPEYDAASASRTRLSSPPSPLDPRRPLAASAQMSQRLLAWVVATKLKPAT